MPRSPVGAASPTKVFFAPLRVILEAADITRPCHCLDDLTFAFLGVWRARQASAKGRDFLPTQALPQVPELARGNYFASLSSPRRLALLPDLARHRRTNQLPNLRAQHTLLAYDRAASDFQYTNKLKPTKSSYLITRWQDNLAPVTTRARPIDRANPANELIISDETVTFQDTPGTGRKLTAQAPLSAVRHRQATCYGPALALLRPLMAQCL